MKALLGMWQMGVALLFCFSEDLPQHRVEDATQGVVVEFREPRGCILKFRGCRSC